MAFSLASLAATAIGSIASNSGNLLGTIIGVNAAKKENKKERDFNAEQAQLNRDYQTQERIASQEWNEDMWNKNNEYNSASSQIQRMLEAGINPNAAFSSGYSSAEAAAPRTNPQSGAQASYSSSLGSSILSAASQMALNIATTDKLQSETKNTEHRTVNDDKRTNAEIEKIMSDIGFQNHTKDLQNLMYNISKNESEARIKVMKEQLNTLRNQSLAILKGIDLTEANIKKIFSDIIVNEANVDKIKQDTATSAAQEANLIQDTKIGEQEEKTEKANAAIQGVIAEWSTASGIPVGATGSEAAFVLWANGKFDECFDKLTLDDYYSKDWKKYSFSTGDIQRRFEARSGKPFGYLNYNMNDHPYYGRSIYTK